VKDAFSRLMVILSAAACLLVSGRAGGQAPAAPAPHELLVYIGTYADQHEEGIHICRFNLETGLLTRVGGVAGIKNPSFQALHPNGKFLYSVSETSDYEGEPVGSVWACAVTPGTGALQLLNSQSTMGAGPCYVSLDSAASHVLAANYGGGSVVVLPVKPDGSLEMASSFVQHNGASVSPRQQEPHAHSINVDPTGQFALAADLGTDQIMIYQFDQRRGLITPNPELPAAAVRRGAGPRHLAFHPSGKFVYLINELNSTITAFTYDGRHGTLTTRQSISTLPADFRGENSTAEVAVSPDGRFVYGSNRGHNSIAVFAIDQETGKLAIVSYHETLGDQPRNFALDPTGAYLLAANQRSDNVVVFRVDRTTGRLTPTGQPLKIPQPVCVTWTKP
jgi:6-phosphogluconolactonase